MYTENEIHDITIILFDASYQTLTFEFRDFLKFSKHEHIYICCHIGDIHKHLHFKNYVAYGDEPTKAGNSLQSAHVKKETL